GDRGRQNAAYHREKMILCKQEEAGIQLNAEQADWRDDTDDDDELKDQELEMHYMHMAQIQEVSPDTADSGPIFDAEPLQKVSNDDHYNVFAIESAHSEQSKPVHDTYPIEQDAHTVIIDSLDMSYDREEIDHNDDNHDLDNERELLASLIEKLKCEIDESKNRNKFSETSNKLLIEKLKGEIRDFKNKNKSLESLNNHFKEVNNKLSETNNLLYTDFKKSEAELARQMKNKLSAHPETISILSQQKEAQIKLYKTRDDKELDKVIALENKVKVLDNIVYKTGQSVQTMNMLNNKCRTSFAKPEFLKKAQRENPHLYDIGCYNDNLSLMLASESNEVIRLEKETRSKLSDLIRPFDYDKLNNLYDLFVPQREKSYEQRYFSERSRLSHTSVNNGNSNESFNKQATLLEKRMDESIPWDKKYSLKSQLESQKTQFLNEIDRLSRKDKNDKSFKEILSKEFRKERKQYFEIQDLKAQLQDKGIVISELKKLIAKLKGKSVDTKFEKSSVIRQSNAFKSQRQSVLGKPTIFSNPLERKDLSKSKSVTQNNVSNDFSKPVTSQILPPNKKSILKNTNVLAPGIPQLKSNPIRDRVMHNNSQGKKQEVEDKRRNVKLSKNKMFVTAYSDSLNAKTLNVNFVSDTCGKCVLNDKKDMCVLNSRKILVEIILFIFDSGCSKHMTGNLKLLINFVEKFLGMMKFRNDQIASILGYGDLVQGAVTIKRVYYVEGLNHNIFSVGQFCDADLDVAFQKSTCYIHDLKGNDLLTATSSQAWLWHRRLSHLNFDTINLLSKNDIVVGLPKLKFVKDHLCSSYELGKAKRKSFHTKTTPSTKRRLQLLHMDLCGPMRVASINGRSYVLVIVDDYSRYTWTHFLRSKDETPEVLIEFLKLVQKGLQAQVRIVRTDKGTEFLNQILHAYFAVEEILHQNSLCYIVRDGENLNKMKEKGDACIFVRYSSQSRAYRVFNKITRVIVETIHVNFDEFPQMASNHVSSDPVPECQRVALEHVSLSPGLQCQDYVTQPDKTVTTSNELDLLFSSMFDELLNGSSKVVSKSSPVTTADTGNQRLQQQTTPLNNQTTTDPTCQVPPQAPNVASNESINQAEMVEEYAQVENDEFINIFCTPVQDRGETLTRVISTISVSRPQLKSNPIGDRVMRNNSQGKKQEVEDQRRNVKLSKNKTFITTCNDSLNAKTLHVNFVSATCDKCVLNDNHDMCVLNSVAKPLKKTVASESNQKPRNITRKLYERVSKTCSWWYPKLTPSGYKWKPKSGQENVNSNVSMPLENASRTANVMDPMTSRRSNVSNTPLSSNSFAARTVKFRNDQIVPILGYGDLGNDLLTGSRDTDLYSITLQDTNSPNPICLMAKATSSQAWLWHRRLSYLNFYTINLLSKNDIVIGLPKLKFVKDHLCSSCARTPEQNRVVERRNRTLVEAARTMLSAAKVPLFFWAEAIATTCFTQNRSLVIPRHEKIPYHIINDRKPSVKFFHIFGSLCYIVRDGENLDKMKEKGNACIFMEYSTQSRAYKVFIRRTRVIVETIHVNFDELPQMASDHVSSDPAPECQRMALKHGSLSPGPQCHENVTQADRVSR
nr:retrovirus-related Pol polyprotein from transposon TNT 1-94 [Tanacetum cinerariifolium]